MVTMMWMAHRAMAPCGAAMRRTGGVSLASRCGSVVADRAACREPLQFPLARGLSTKPAQAIPVDRNRVLETSVVQNAESTLMRWVGRGSAMQMYCTIIYAGKLIYEADPSANIYEIVATSGAMVSASACVFFGAKLLCDKIVTDIDSCRNFGEKDEFVRLTIQGALAKYALHVTPEDISMLSHDGSDVYKFQVGARNFSLNVAHGSCTSRKTLENLLQGKPLVTRKGKQRKKARSN